MAIAGDILKNLIRKELDKNIKKLEHDVDCIVKDIRAGRGGGLNIKNIASAINLYKPPSIDISSGVETIQNGLAIKGVKDKEKIKKFVESVAKVNCQI